MSVSSVVISTGNSAVGQIIELAIGGHPTDNQLVAWNAYQQSGGSWASIFHAFVASSAFANVYNGGVAVNPDAPITSSIAEGLISKAIGAHTSAQVQAWASNGLSVADVFQAFALNDHFGGQVVPFSNVLQVTGAMVSTIGGFVVTFHNAPSEVLAGGTGASSHVDVTPALTTAQALDMAAAHAAQSQPGGLIPADTGVIDWFQYGGDTYVIEAINSSVTPEAHDTLLPTDSMVEVMGLVDLTNAQFSGYTLTF